MKLSSDIINDIMCDYGEAFYVLDSNKFKKNYLELEKAFKSIYPNFNIAYSYKTNYIPKLCKIVNELGGYAEVVSELEVELAIRCGVKPTNIIWNGPVKNNLELEKYLLTGVIVNIDSLEEAEIIRNISSSQDKKINVGIRCNYDVNDSVISRFGLDVNSRDFIEVLNIVNSSPQLNFINLHCHFAKRNIEFWEKRVSGMIDLLENLDFIPEKIDLGGGLFGKMENSLKSQFQYNIPSYREYAEVVATEFSNLFKKSDKKPELLIEPGTAIVGDCLQFIGTIQSIKNIRGTYFATLLGSQHNINMKGIKPPIEIINQKKGEVYESIDIVGYTCIESDVIYQNYSGQLSVGDIVIINNCGSYSIVMKPPFILPNFPILEINDDCIEVIKRKEVFDDIFNTYNF